MHNFEKNILAWAIGCIFIMTVAAGAQINKGQRMIRTIDAKTGKAVI